MLVHHAWDTRDCIPVFFWYYGRCCGFTWLSASGGCAMGPGFHVGDKVCLRNRRGRVGEVRSYTAMAGSCWYSVDSGDGTRSYEEQSLEPWEPSDDVKPLPRMPRYDERREP